MQVRSNAPDDTRTNDEQHAPQVRRHKLRNEVRERVHTRGAREVADDGREGHDTDVVAGKGGHQRGQCKVPEEESVAAALAGIGHLQRQPREETSHVKRSGDVCSDVGEVGSSRTSDISVGNWM